MLLNRLVVTPSAETVEYFTAILAGSPIEININSFEVEIITTSGSFTTNPTTQYSAMCGTLATWYDPARQESSLILPLVSDDLQNRFDEICNTGALPYWNIPSYKPHMVFKFAMPSRNNHYRGFLNSISTTLATSGRPLVFNFEYAELVDQIHPLNYEYSLNY